MASDQRCGALGKVSAVFATKLKSFTFLPVRKKLPTKGKVITAKEEESSSATAFEDLVGLEGSLADGGVYKAKVVYVRDSEDMEPEMINKHSQTQSQLSPTESPTPAMDHAEIGYLRPQPSPVTTETTHNKHPGISQLGCHNTFSGTEVNSGLFLDSMSQRDEGVLSPASSVDIFTSPASSKESLLSEGWEQERSWSALRRLSPTGSPVPFISPCSSVRSGSFTPSVVRIKRHALASGSSLAQMPQSSSRTLCCDSQAPLPCPLSPRARHRTPPTQLSLLTAILRKGRLPVLSAALQRPYSPCWPISPASVSSCVACSAASTLAPMEGSLAKPCGFSNMGCKESSHRVKPKFDSDTLSTSPKIHNNLGISRKSESNSFNIPGNNSRVISSPQSASSLILSSSSPYQPREVQTDTCVPTVDSSWIFSSFSRARSLSPKSNPLSCYSSKNQTPAPVSRDHSVLLGSDHSKESQDPFSSGPGHESTSNGFTRINDTKLSHAPSSTWTCAQMPDGPSPIPGLKCYQSSQDTPGSGILKHASNSPRSHSPNFKKASPDLGRALLVSPTFGLSPPPRTTGLTRLACTPPACPSPRPNSCSPVSDCRTLSPSPAVPSRQLSPSPSHSFCSSPSPSLMTSTPDCTDRGGKSRKPYKIKSTYKALAAIPTNTLLQEQQAIDDEVEMNEASLDPSDSFAWEDPHSQMCTPAQLRQQSAELYAVIDEVMEDTNQTRQSSPANKLTVTSTASETTRKLTSTPSPRSLGRETKYASFPLQPPGPTERATTKPGVIRPVTVRMVNDKVDEYFLNPFQRYQDNASNRYQYTFISSKSSTEDELDGRRTSGRMWPQGQKDPFEKPGQCASHPALPPALSSGHNSPSLRSLQHVPPSFESTQVKMETQETHI